MLVVDAGLLNLWSHDRAPVLPDGVLSEAATADVNAGADFRIEGPDALLAGKSFDRQWDPMYLYDLPAHALTDIEEKFAECIRVRGLQASLVRLSERMPHRQRVERAIEYGRGAGELQMHGVPLVAVAGLPRDRELDVVGERMGNGPFPDCWKWVALQVSTGSIDSSVQVGVAGVDWARLLFIDADAVGAWEHERTLDGLADFVFWGRDAASVAAEHTVGALSVSEFGWLDLPIEEAVRRGIQIEELRERGDRLFRTDFRPHSHHYRLMKPVRESPTGSGTIEVDGANCCGFHTSWGDGMFPVWIDKAKDGSVVGVRIELATPETVRKMLALNGMEDAPPGQSDKA